MVEGVIFVVSGNGDVVIVTIVPMGKEIQSLSIENSIGERRTRAAFKEKAFVLEEGHVILETEEMDLLNDREGYGQNRPLVTVHTLASLQVEKIKIPFRIANRIESNGTGISWGHGVGRIGVIIYMNIGTKI